MYHEIVIQVTSLYIVHIILYTGNDIFILTGIPGTFHDCKSVSIEDVL
jgi:hypothetical protein